MKPSFFPFTSNTLFSLVNNLCFWGSWKKKKIHVNLAPLGKIRGRSPYQHSIFILQIQWFWRALRSFEQADRACFLQFVTGTSKVPLQGFAYLEGMNGIQKFQIHRDDRSTDRLPSAHTWWVVTTTIVTYLFIGQLRCWNTSQGQTKVPKFVILTAAYHTSHINADSEYQFNVPGDDCHVVCNMAWWCTIKRPLTYLYN